MIVWLKSCFSRANKTNINTHSHTLFFCTVTIAFQFHKLGFFQECFDSSNLFHFPGDNKWRGQRGRLSMCHYITFTLHFPFYHVQHVWVISVQMHHELKPNVNVVLSLCLPLNKWEKKATEPSEILVFHFPVSTSITCFIFHRFSPLEWRCPVNLSVTSAIISLCVSLVHISTCQSYQPRTETTTEGNVSALLPTTAVLLYV